MNISVQELKEKLDRGDKFLFIDVREPWEYEEFNLGAQNIPLGDLMNRMWEFEDYKDSEIVLHCKSGSRSGMAQSLMAASGFNRVLNLSGGALAWKEAYG